MDKAWAIALEGILTLAIVPATMARAHNLASLGSELIFDLGDIRDRCLTILNKSFIDNQF
jgi:hypothetical protein